MKFLIIKAKKELSTIESEDLLSEFLSEFAESHKENEEEEIAGRYGTYFENDKVMMHKFCWCGDLRCPWCRGEILPEIIKLLYGIEKKGDTAPNFWYKPLDFKVWWYKYIGRGMEVNKNLTEEEFNTMVNTLIPEK